jgi:glutamine---fructose-6-phosphate transaminase (isomerizing)
MCGIFGLVYNENPFIDAKKASEIIDNLFILSESRGKEASGFAVRYKDKIEVFKSAEPAGKLIKKNHYKKRFDKQNTGLTPYAFIGHSRLVTNGRQLENSNNQPVIKNHIAGIHNGIVCNVGELWEEFSHLNRSTEVDTEIILALFQEFVHRTGSFRASIKEVFQKIEGAASIALLPDYSDMLFLATNTGSLYYTQSEDERLFVFASEKFILKNVLDSVNIEDCFKNIVQLKSDEAIEFNLNDCSYSKFAYPAFKDQDHVKTYGSKNAEIVFLEDDSKNNFYDIMLLKNRISGENREKMWDRWEELYIKSPLKRCKKCALPETMTFIDFDENGVCNYCRGYQKFGIKGIDALKKEMIPFIKNDSGRDCLVGISGGRDSCYGLHYIKNELDLNPITFTFDWAVVTDLSRRNISRMCSKLGIEHVIFSADINWKRNNIRKNINAWFKKPHLGMLPLLMAGDKEMHKFAKKLINQTGLELLFWCCGHNYEHTPFKIGFAGIPPTSNTFFHWVSWKNKLNYFSFFLKNFTLNRSYINSSIFDSFMAAMWQFVLPLPESAFLLYEYVPWDENVINDTLINEYNWELSPDTSTTWRIGDGTAAFYNFIYMAVSGITEHDTFRSSQIREGALDRDTAIQLIKEDNKPRFETIEWYANIIGFDVNSAIKIINDIPRHYA